MIPSPNLDDRTFKDIVDEAIRLIPHYCPEWTNHNPSDPGITLIELFAWMTEMIIYRINQVPEKVYLTLLDLIGLSMMPPQASRALLTFTPVERYEGEVRVKRGTQITTSLGDTAEPLIFETIKDLIVTNIKLMACISTKDGKVTDNLSIQGDLDARKDGFSLFAGEEEIERYIYISDPAFEYLTLNNIVQIKFNNANDIKTMSDEIVNLLEWEYWDGSRWSTVEQKRSVPGIKRQDNVIYFMGPFELTMNEVEGYEGFFLRAKIVAIPEREKCFEINDVVTTLIFHGEGLNPDISYFNTDNMIFNQIDLSKEFQPFMEAPKYNDAFYIASQEVFSKEDSEINIDIYLSDADSGIRSEPSDSLLMKFEYWNGQNWMELGKTTPLGTKEPVGKFNFMDRTNALSRSGKVQFNRPYDMKTVEVNGQDNYWIRIRIGAGDFGTGGQFVIQDNGKWEWRYDRPSKPPVLNRIKLRYIASGKPVAYLISYYDFSYRDFSKKNIDNFLLKNEEDVKIPYVKLCEISKEKCPITYLGFNRKFPSGDFGLYFKINERGRIRPIRNTGFVDRLDIKTVKSNRSVSLKWEYWTGKKWADLSVNDYTDGFHESGFVEFNPPDDIANKQEFGNSLYWIRVILESGSFENNPRIISINLNSVFAENMRTYVDEAMGSSNGSPSQEFELLNGPVLSDIEIMVREKEIPPADERELLMAEVGKDAIEVVKGNDGSDEIWIKYYSVSNFFNSTPKSRHYILDYINSKIIFGDGRNGLVPPRLRNNIRAKRYKTGGGSKGNVGHNTINLLRENIPYIVSVVNPYPAEGGADLEDIHSLKSRATNVFKNLNRAVTIEDYEWLAREASFSVARSKCLSKIGKNGEISVIIVPRPDSDDYDLTTKLEPNTELIRRVREFLNDRKLVGTKLKVEAPRYCNITINLRLVFRKDIAEIQIIKQRIELSIRRFLHPMTGGADGKGWPFGMPLTKNDIFAVLEKIDEIYYVEDIEILDEDANVPVDQLVLEEDSLIHLSGIKVKERKMQF